MRDDVRHIPVLETTVLKVLSPKPGEDVLDCTLGLGGHALRFLEATSPDGKLTGIDADDANLEDAKVSLKAFGDRARFIHANFGSIASLGLPPADILFADLGVSSPHFDDPERGMSFRQDGPLDLRFDRSGGKPASQRIAEAEEEELHDVFHRYGELKGVGLLVPLLRKNPPQTTADMRAIVEEAFKWKAPKLLPQIFQALRIWVNDELAMLENLLLFIPAILKPGGRAGIISFHSLEDRLVKHSFRSLAAPEKDPVTGKVTREPGWCILTPKGEQPSASEISENPRSRSARLRVIQKLP